MMRGLLAWRRSAAASVAGRKWVWTSMVIESRRLPALAAAIVIHWTNGSARPRLHSGDGRASGARGPDPRGGAASPGRAHRGRQDQRRRRCLDSPASVERLDASGMVVAPGLINAHYHSGENFNPGPVREPAPRPVVRALASGDAR